MPTTMVATVYPQDAFDPEVNNAPLITRAGVAVDNTVLAAVQAAASANGITLLVGGAGPNSPAPSDPVTVLPATIGYAGPPTSGKFVAGQQITDLNGAVWIAKGANAAAGFYQPGNGTSGAPNWAASTAYKAGQLVAYQNGLYRAKADFTSGASFNASNWDALGGSLPSQLALHASGQVVDSGGALDGGGTGGDRYRVTTGAGDTGWTGGTNGPRGDDISSEVALGAGATFFHGFYANTAAKPFVDRGCAHHYAFYGELGTFSGGGAVYAEIAGVAGAITNNRPGGRAEGFEAAISAGTAGAPVQGRNVGSLSVMKENNATPTYYSRGYWASSQGSQDATAAYYADGASGWTDFLYFVGADGQLKARIDGVTGQLVSTGGVFTSGAVYGPGFFNNLDSGRQITWGTGAPEGVVAAKTGSLFLRMDGSAAATLYVKETGTGNTGWTAVGGGGAVSSVAGKTGAVSLVKADVGLGNVDNTSDASKPVSTAQTTAISAAQSAATSAAATAAAGLYAADLTERTNNTSETVPAGTTTNCTTAGVTKTGPALDNPVATPPKRWSVRNGSTGTITVAYPDPNGTAQSITMIPGEVLTFRQKSTSGWAAESGNKPLTSLDGRYATAPQPSSIAAGTTITKIFDPTRQLYNGQADNLRRFRAALSKAQAGIGVCSAMQIGDSTAAGTGATRGVTDAISALRGLLKQRGFTVYGTGMVPVAQGPVDNRLTAVGAAGLGSGGFTSWGTGVGVTFTPDLQCDSFTIAYLKSGSGGNLSYSVDGGASTTLSCNGTSGIYTQVVSAGTLGSHTLTVTGGPSGNGFLVAVAATAGTVGVVTHNFGHNGAGSAMVGSGGTGFPGQLYNAVGATAPALTLLGPVGINDYSNSLAVATYTANMQNGITYCQNAGSDVLLVPPLPPADLSKTPAYNTFVSGLYGLADSNNVPIFDVATRWKDYATSNPLGFYSDSLHPNVQGYADIARGILAMFSV